MGILIDKSDFKGDYALVKSGSDDINLFIEKYEQQILSQLLGSDLLFLFQADLDDKIPQGAIYKALYDPFVKKIEGCAVEFIGMKEMVLAYVYFFYVKKNSIKPSMNGAVVNDTENGQQANKTFLFGVYNRSIRAYNVVRYLCKSNTVDYPGFAGVHKEYTSIL